MNVAVVEYVTQTRFGITTKQIEFHLNDYTAEQVETLESFFNMLREHGLTPSTIQGLTFAKNVEV